MTDFLNDKPKTNMSQELSKTGDVKIQYIKQDALHGSPTNPRKHFAAEPLEELSRSIEEHGIQMPLLCRVSPHEEGKFEIVAGERRWRANGLLLERLASAGRDEMYERRLLLPVILRVLDDATVLELQLIENLQRTDLTALEEAAGYQALLDLPGKAYTPTIIAQRVSKNVQTVRNKLRMLGAPQVLQDALADALAGISPLHLVLVSKVAGAQNREQCAREIMQGEFDYELQKKVPMSARETAVHITEKYRRPLKGVAWDLADAELVPEAGACVTCPHFAQHAATQDEELAAELGGARGQTQPLTCMDPACHQRKQAAAFRRCEAAAKEGVVTVMKPKEAAAIMSASGIMHWNAKWVKLDDKPGHAVTGHYDASKLPTWRVLIGDRLPPGALTVANTELGGIIELVLLADAMTAAQGDATHGELFQKMPPSGKKELTEEQAKQKEKEVFAGKVMAREKNCLLQHLFDSAMAKGLDADGGLAVLDCLLHEAGMEGNRLICSWQKLEPAAVKKGDELSQGHYRAAIMTSLRARDAGKPEIDAMIMIAGLAKWVKVYGQSISSLGSLQEYFGFDKRTITALATAEVRAEMAAKAAKKKPAVAVKNNSVDPVEVSAEKEAGKTAAADARAKDGDGLKPELRTKKTKVTQS